MNIDPKELHSILLDKTTLPEDMIREIIKFCTVVIIENNETFRENLELWRNFSPAVATARNKMIQRYGELSQWDTRFVTDMSHAFLNQANFAEDISNWNVSNVTSMEAMFWGCENLNVDLSRWDVGNVKDMEGVFGNCDGNIGNISFWNTRKAITMEIMFYRFKGNTSLDLSWDISCLINTKDIFFDCNSIRNKEYLKTVWTSINPNLGF